MGIHRRVWQGDNGRAQIEVRGLDNPENEDMRTDVKNALPKLKTVKWIEVNALTRRLAVAFDSRTPIEKLVSVVESVEMVYGIRERSPPPEWESDIPFDHPLDEEPIHRAVAALAGNSLALGLSVIGQLTGKVIFMDRLASTLTLINLLPQSQSFVEDHFGRLARQLLFPC